MLLVNCKKDTICNDPTNPSCKNYDACYQKTAADARFYIYENINEIGIEADTVWWGNWINFVAKRDSCTYKWTVKTQGFIYTSTKHDFALNASIQLIPVAKMYTVTLVTTKDQVSCNSVKAKDSVTKQF